MADSRSPEPQNRKAGGDIGKGSVSLGIVLTWTPKIPGSPSPAHQSAIPRGRRQDTVHTGDGQTAALGDRYSCVVLRAGRAASPST
jgi:hypothetical protein